MAGNIADDEPKLSRGEREHVVPITADGFALGGHVSRREFKTWVARQLVGEEAAFQERGGGAFDARGFWLWIAPATRSATTWSSATS